MRFLLPLVMAFIVSACAYPSTIVEQGGEQGMIYFTEAPPGARVFIDGADAGEAMTFDGRRQVLSLEPGRHNVRVVSGAAELYSSDVYVGAGSRMEVRVQ